MFRSPFLPASPKEIFINFEPLEKKQKKKLGKTLSDGEILESKSGKEEEPCSLSDGELASAKSTQDAEEEDQLGPTITHNLEPPNPRKLVGTNSNPSYKKLKRPQKLDFLLF